MTKRILTLVVVLALTVGLLPMAASADGGAFGSAPTKSLTISLDGLFQKILTSNVPFEQLPQKTFTISVTGDGAAAGYSATATATLDGLTGSNGSYTGAALFRFPDNIALQT